MQIDDAILIELGRIAVGSAKLENALLDLLYEFTNEDFAEAVKALGTPGVSNALDSAKDLVKASSLPAESKKAIRERLGVVRNATERRNEVLHAEWVAADVQRRGRGREPRRLQRVDAATLRNVATALDNVASSIRWCWEQAVQDLGRLDPSSPTGVPDRWDLKQPGPVKPAARVVEQREVHAFFFGSGQLSAAPVEGNRPEEETPAPD